MTGLNCYCDHCPNNTCTTKEGGLCYAEWAISTASAAPPSLLSSTTASTSATTSSGIFNNINNNNNNNNLQHIYNNNLPLRLEKKFNCFNKDNTLFQSIVCNETVSNTSNVIRKCCNNENHCNSKNVNLLPSEEKAYQLFEAYWPQQMAGASKSSSDDESSGLLQYSEYVFISLSVVMLLVVVVFALKRFKILRSFITRQRGEEDCSENSSGKANSDAAVYDTNSMASREPLINYQRAKLNPLYQQQNSLAHHHPGPFMSDETFNGKTPSTFQMTIGSATEQNTKPETSSGSGAGQPYLTQRSIAHDIELVEVVGRGFFGVVWRGEYKGEPVAVKIFSPMAEPSWEREAEIYQTTMLRHKNILGFIATDKRHDAAMTGYWLVTDYYPMGSLYDFLHENTMSMSDAIRMAFSIANGLSHLHVEIFGTQGKPAIAHRDFKSKNILVKNDGTCCIADLGMAVRYNSSTGIVDVPTNSRVGTRRYLAPEILEGQLNLMDFEAVKATDIYAMGLVLWEIMRRACLLHPSSLAGTGSDPNSTYSVELAAYQSKPPTAASASSSASSSPTSGKISSKSGAGSEAAIPSVAEETPTPPSEISPITSNQPSTSNPSTSQQNNQPIVSTSSEQPPPKHIQPSSIPPADYDLPPQKRKRMFYDSMESTYDDVNNEHAMHCEPYEAPYQSHVSVDPSTEEMRQVVCEQKVRPQLSPRWSKFASTREYVTLMCECWYEKPQARLSALRVRKSLGELARRYFNLNMEYD